MTNEATQNRKGSAIEDRAESDGRGGRAGPCLLGRFPAKIDSKGRILLPPSFRQQLPASISFFPAFTGDELLIGGGDLYDDLLDLFAGLDAFEEERYALELSIGQRMAELAPDETGRVVLPPALRSEAGLEGPLGFAGRGHYGVLTSAARLDGIEAKALTAAKSHEATIRARMLPSVRRERRT